MKQGCRFNWRCAHCGKRDIATFRCQQFDAPKYYSVEWECPKCGKATDIRLTIETVPVCKKLDTAS